MPAARVPFDRPPSACPLGAGMAAWLPLTILIAAIATKHEIALSELAMRRDQERDGKCCEGFSL